MREIHIDLSSDNYLQQPKVFGGYEGEHNETKLIVTLPSRLLTNDISYYYFDFQTAVDEHITSPNIYKNELVDGNKISILLWEQLLTTEGNLTFCVSAAQTQPNGDLILKGKTSICYLNILKSPSGTETIINPDCTKEVLQQAIDSALQIAKDSGEFQGDKGDPFTYEDFTPEQLADLKGYTGDPGVYYGTEEPTDPSHPLWINPENDANDEIIELAKETAELTAQATLSSWVEAEVEEGTWTPEVWVNNPNNGASVLSQPTYSTDNGGWIGGYFKRVGNLIYITCDINIDIESLPANSTENYVQIFGLPFTSNNVPTGNNVLRKARGGALSNLICFGAISQWPGDETPTEDGSIGATMVVLNDCVYVRNSSGVNERSLLTGKLHLGFSGCYLTY